MALTKFMHPRNPYKNGVDFKALAAEYEEFREAATSDLQGKIRVDFKDPKALRALTRCCLKKTFGLDVELPPDRLVPTLPLRLNYLLWVEDLLVAAGLASETGAEAETTAEVVGVDVGAGASCVFPLLGARKFGWRWVATEIDESSVACARRNVEANGLGDRVRVVKAEEGGPILGPALAELGPDTVVDFTVCNPPFFEDDGERPALPAKLQRREERRAETNKPRPPPKNAETGVAKERRTKGGELSIISKMLEEGKQLGDRFRFFTSMLGSKQSLKEARAAAVSAGARTVMTTQFCQGNTMRWGLAWSFGDALERANAAGVPSYAKPGAPPADDRRRLAEKPAAKEPLVWVVSADRSFGGDVGRVCSAVEAFFDEIGINFRVVSQGPGWKSLQVSSADGKLPNVRLARRAKARREAGGERANKEDSEPDRSPELKKPRVESGEEDRKTGDSAASAAENGNPAAEVGQEKGTASVAPAARVKIFFTLVKTESEGGVESTSTDKCVQLKCAFECVDKDRVAANFQLQRGIFQILKNFLSGVYDK